MKSRNYILRRYCPPTSNSAFVICPSEQTRTASISTSKTFLFSITAWWRRLNFAGPSLACKVFRQSSGQDGFCWLITEPQALVVNIRP